MKVASIFGAGMGRVSGGVSGLALAVALAGPAAAQQVSGDAPAEPTRPDIVVTGSRIPHPDVESNSPVSVVSGETIKLAASNETDRILNMLPQFAGSAGAGANLGSGAASVNLRNLGAVRTLVLINGRRVVGSSPDGVVDINMIPPALLERVDVLTGGASAVYGSDAMAGVVNFVLKDNFTGVQLGADSGISDRGDARNYQFDLTAGTNFAGDRGNVAIYASYYNRDPVYASARSYATRYLVDAKQNGVGVLVPGGNATTPQGTIFAPGLVGKPDQFGNPISASGIFFAPGGWRAYTPADAYNDKPYAYIQMPLERYEVSLNGHYKITDDVTAFWEGTYAHTKTGYSNAAVPMGTASFINNFQLDLRNPYLPASLRTLLGTLDPDGDNLVSVNMNRRLNELGLRSTDQRRDFWRVVGGLKGNLTSRLKWELFVNYGRSTIEDHQYGGVRLDHFQQGLLTNPANPMACATADPNCVVLNLFGANSLTPAMANYLSAGDLVNRTRIEQTQVGGNISGTLFSLPAGDVGVSVGGEYRRESSSFLPDPLYVAGEVLARFAGLQPTQGSYDVKEANAELYVPILAHMPGFKLLAVEAGVRISDYSSVGSVTAYKFGGEYTPFEGLKLRASFERAVRAPNVNELYGGLTSTAPLATDFCNATASRTAAQRTFCQQLGVPAALIDTFNQENAFITVVSGGNAHLKAETSNTWSFGAVLRPSMIPQLQLTVDYYNIEVNNAIAGFGGGLASTIGACAANMALSNPFCVPLEHRSPDGQLFQVPLLNTNIANLTSKGVDFQLSYNHALGAGRLSYMLAGTYLIRNTTQGGPGLPVVDCAGFIGGGACGDANPHWRLNQRLTYSIDKVELTLNHRMIGSARDGRIASAIANGVAPPSLAVPRTPDIHYFDLGVFVAVNDRFSLHAAANNIFDRLPPYQLFELDTYDAIGRAFTIGANVKF